MQVRFKEESGITTTERETMPKDNERIFCNGCMKKTRHLLLFHHMEEGGDEEFSWNHDHQVLQCQGCENITFRIDHTDSESYSEDGLWHSYTYYPPPVSRRKPVWFDELPSDIRLVMEEVYVALQAGSRYLATVGARTVLDLLITDKIGDVGTFKDKIAKLETDKHITHPEAELIEAVTEAGNASAHRGFRPDATSLNHVMDILEAVLDKFYAAENRQYTLALQAEELKKKIPPRK